MSPKTTPGTLSSAGRIPCGEADIVNCDRVLGKMKWIRQLSASTLVPGQTAMPCTARASAANPCYHVLNRGNNRASVFHKDGDFDAFVDLWPKRSCGSPCGFWHIECCRTICIWRSGPWEMETWAAGCSREM